MVMTLVDPAKAALEVLRREDARRGFLDFVKFCEKASSGTFEVSWHHRVMTDAVDAWLAGAIKRLMVFAPPRHGKSEIFSRNLPPYAFGINPHTKVIAASYGASLASAMGKSVQRIMQSPEYKVLFPESRLATRSQQVKGEGVRQADYFEVIGHRGEYLTSGVGGAFVGKGFNIGIIDDPFKDRAEAGSLNIRDSKWDWYRAAFYTRAEPGACILIMHQRWDEDDIAGRILRDEPGQWTVLNFEAIRTGEPVGFDDPRQKGDPLWPSKYSLEALEQIKASIGTYEFEAQYQGRPRPIGERVFNAEWFIVREAEPPRGSLWFMTVDAAFGEKRTHDEAAILVSALDPDNFRHFRVMESGNWGPDKLVKKILEIADQYPPVSIGLELGAAAVIKAWLHQEMYRRGVSYSLKDLRSPRGSGPDPKRSGSAKLRIEALVPYFEQRRITFSPQVMASKLPSQLLDYPRCIHDDCADVAAYSLQQSRHAAAHTPVITKHWSRMTLEEQSDEWVKSLSKKSRNGFQED